MNKQCDTCLQIKDIENFKINKRNKDKRNNKCLECENLELEKYRESIKEKECPKCKIVKSKNEFGICNKRKDGLKYYCKECRNEEHKEYYHDRGGKEKLQERQKTEEFKEKRREYMKQYGQTEYGKEKLRNFRKKWINSEKGKEYNTNYQKQYKKTEKYKEKAREYDKTTRKENALVKQEEFQKNNTHKLCSGNFSCGKYLPLDAFNRDKTTITGYEHTCRECKKNYKLSEDYLNNLKNMQDEFKKKNDSIICISCKNTLSLDQFQIKNDSATGFSSVCKNCLKEKIRSDSYQEELLKKQEEFIKNNTSIICKTCNKNKFLDEFHKDKYDNTGYHFECKECCRIRREERKERFTLETQYQYRIENPKKSCVLCSKHFPRNEEFFSFSSSSEDGLNGSCKSCMSNYLKNKRSTEKYRKKAYEYQKNRINENIQVKIKLNVSRMIYQKLKKRLASKETLSTFKDILPYTIEQLMNHLESQFEDGMTWENYGKGEGKWEIDHNIPDSWFNYKSVHDKEFKKSWALENLQPMWSLQNTSKNNRFAGKLPEHSNLPS